MTVLRPSPVLELLADASAGLGDAERRLYETMAAGYPGSLHQPAARLLRAAKASPLDLERLLAAAGFADYSELGHRVDAEENSRLSSPDARFGARLRRRSSAETLLDRIAEHEQENLRHTLQALRENGSLELAAGRIVAARRRFVTGGPKSLGYATLLAADLQASMAGVTLVDGTVVRPIDVLSDVRGGDVLVAFAFRRYSRQTVAFAREFRVAGGGVIGVTDSASGPLAESCDLPVVVATSSASYADSPTAVVSVVHALATLAAAGAKGARRRMARRDELVRSLEIYEGS